jgi:PhoD-like phosphatase/Secretion system C-terminal sorting domain
VITPYFFKGNRDVPRYHPVQGWEVFPYERRRIFDSINSNGISNIVFISGDIHNAMAFDIPLGRVPYNPSTGEGSAAVEFVCDNVTEGEVLPNDPQWMYGNNSHLKAFKGSSSGYCVLDISGSSVCCNYWETSDASRPSTQKTLLRTICTMNGENHLGYYCGPSPDPRIYPGLAPLYPLEQGCEVLQKSIEILGIYPNPAREYIRFQYFVLQNQGSLSVELYDILGKRLAIKSMGQQAEGLYEDALNVQGLSSGEYLIVFNTGTERVAKKLIKL